MADEEITPPEGDEGVVVPGEGAENEAEIASPPAIDEYARSRGWTSKEEWVEAGRAEGDWRDAEAFLDYGLDRSRDLGKDLKELRSTVDAVRDANVRTAQEAAERGRVEERAKWENIHTKAVEEGDTETAKAAVDEITKVTQAAPQGDPLVNQWRSENTWFDSDPIAQSVAKAASGVAAQQGKPVVEQLEAARQAVYDRFPEHAPKKPAKAVEVGAPAAAANPPKRGKSFHDLPTENQEAARALKSAGLLPNGVDGYVKQYFNKEGTVL